MARRMTRRPRPSSYPDFPAYWFALCDWLVRKYAGTYPVKGAK